jgi:hypothetical protein
VLYKWSLLYWLAPINAELLGGTVKNSALNWAVGREGNFKMKQKYDLSELESTAVLGALEALHEADVAGIRVRVDGDDLVLAPPAPTSPELLSRLEHHGFTTAGRHRALLQSCDPQPCRDLVNNNSQRIAK